MTRAHPSNGLTYAAGVLNAFTFNVGAQTRKYGLSEQHCLDLYMPQTAEIGGLAIFFYGSGGRSGSRQMYRFIGSALAAQGIVTVIPDYRVGNGLMSLEDSAEAVVWTTRHVTPGLPGGTPLIFMGHSLGAYVAAALSVDPKWVVSDPNTGRVLPNGLVGIAGPYGYLHSFGTGKPPKALLASPAQDRVVQPSQTLQFADRLRSLGGEVTVKSYATASHASLIGAFSPLLSWTAPIAADSIRFIRELDRL